MRIKFPEGYVISSQHLDEHFVLLYGQNAAFLDVARNASTFLKHIAVFLRTKEIIQDEMALHSIIAYNSHFQWFEILAEFSKFNIMEFNIKSSKLSRLSAFLIRNTIGRLLKSHYLIHVSRIKEYEKKNGKLMKFVVYRDPVERFISVYKFFILGRKHYRYFKYAGLYHDNSFERFIEFAEFELKKGSPIYQDKHIRRQVDCYHPSEVDYIVSLEKLNQFLREQNIPIGPPIGSRKINETNINFASPSQKLLDKVKDLYREDYKIKPNY
jgi:hypothetical protein